jgi:salicylate 5-hydroxylase large subunit
MDPVTTSAPAWPGAQTHRIPSWAYTDPAVYRRELERFFCRGHCYVALEAEIFDSELIANSLIYPL